MTTSATGQDTTTQPKLLCLGGQAPPAGLVDDLQKLEQLPISARERFWEALAPSLGEPMPATAEKELDAFCERYEAAGDTLAQLLKGCRFLLREAAKRDLSRGAFAEDLAALMGNRDSQLSRILLAGYEQSKEFVRRELVRSAVLAHGKLITSIDWRVDTIKAAAGGAKLDAAIVLLTLSYQEGERSERVTLQATPDALHELKRLCAEILG